MKTLLLGNSESTTMQWLLLWK